MGVRECERARGHVVRGRDKGKAKGVSRDHACERVREREMIVRMIMATEDKRLHALTGEQGKHNTGKIRNRTINHTGSAEIKAGNHR